MEIIKNEEAQFMLLAGFIIAIGLVIITVLFNNIIFQTNIAGSTGADPMKYDMANMMQITNDEMKSAYRNATLQSGNKTQKINNFTMQMQNFNSNLSKIYALRAGGVNMSIDVRNWNDSRFANFTDNGTANGAGTWVVMENVKNFTMIINITSIKSSPDDYVEVQLYNATKPYYKGYTSAPTNATLTENTFISSITPPFKNISFSFGANGAGRFNMTGNTTDGRRFTRTRDYMLNASVTLSTSEVRANITIPISVPW